MKPPEEIISDTVYKDVPPFEWELRQALAGTEEHVLIYRDERFAAQAEIVTPKHQDGSFGKGKIQFFLDKDKRVFNSQDELREAILHGPKELWVYAGTTRRTKQEITEPEEPDHPTAPTAA